MKLIVAGPLIPQGGLRRALTWPRTKSPTGVLDRQTLTGLFEEMEQH